MKETKQAYATLDSNSGGMDYRTIAETLSKQGYNLGHSTVRNILLRMLERFAMVIMASYGADGDPAEVARDPNFQNGLAALIQEAQAKGSIQ